MTTMTDSAIAKPQPRSFRVGSVHTKQGVERHQTIRFSKKNFIQQKIQSLTMEYDVGGMIGAGTFGDVYSCVHLESGEERAVKIVDKSSTYDHESIVNEFHTLKELDHPNVLKIYALFDDSYCYAIVTDIYRGGEMYEYIRDKGALPETGASVLLYHLLSSINYCHQNNVVHGDIKPENILLDDKGNFEDIKIIDFGTSRGLTSHDDDSCENGYRTSDYSGWVGTPAYMAPELVDGRIAASAKADIWACGMVAFVCLGGYVPFQGTDEEILDQVADGQVSFDYDVWNTVSSQAIDFIMYLLDPDEMRRPSADEALVHPFLMEAKRRETPTVGRWRHGKTMIETSLGNITQFHSKSKLKQAVCSYMAAQVLAKEDRESIDQVFRVLDANDNGNLDRKEVEHGFKKYYHLVLTSQELDDIFNHVDLDDTGTIEYSEFVVAAIWKRKLLDDKTLKKAFDNFDTDHSGYVDADELRVALSLDKQWDGYVTNIIQEVDDDGDGQISFEEFKATMTIARTNPENSGPSSSSSCASLSLDELASDSRDSNGSTAPQGKDGVDCVLSNVPVMRKSNTLGESTKTVSTLDTSCGSISTHYIRDSAFLSNIHDRIDEEIEENDEEEREDLSQISGIKTFDESIENLIDSRRSSEIWDLESIENLIDSRRPSEIWDMESFEDLRDQSESSEISV